MVRRNILANAVGGSVSAILALALIPVQVRVLGVESYGLLAFAASIQVLFSVFDLGLSPTITREVSRDESDDREVSRRLIRLISLVYWPVGIALGMALFIAAPWLAAHWLHLERLTSDRATEAIQLAAVALALRWPVSFYSGVVAGRQRFVALNVIKTAVAGTNAVVGVAVLLVSHDLLAYMTWMALAAAIELSGYVGIVLKVQPGLLKRSRARPTGPSRVWRYAAGIGVINLLAMVLTQSDRLLISKLLSIQSLGYYALAYNILIGLSLIQGFVTSALFPAFAVSHSAGAQIELRTRYESATQVLMYLYNLPIWLLVIFGHDVLRILASPAAADRAAPLLAVLALGFLGNAAASLAYTASIATGNTSLPIRTNLVGVAIYLPALLLLTLSLGALGAAVAWLILNLYYIPSLIPAVHHRVIRVRTMRWFGQCVLPFVAVGLACFGAGRLALHFIGTSDIGMALGVAAASSIAYVFAAFVAIRKPLRNEIVRSIWQVRLVFSGASRAVR